MCSGLAETGPASVASYISMDMGLHVMRVIAYLRSQCLLSKPAKALWVEHLHQLALLLEAPAGRHQGWQVWEMVHAESSLRQQ